MLLTFILIIISIPSPPHSFIPRSNLPFSASPSPLPFFLLQDLGLLHGLPGLFTYTSEHIRFFYFLVFLFSFLVFGSVR